MRRRCERFARDWQHACALHHWCRTHCGARPRLRKPPTFGVALAPALRRLPALKVLNLNCNPFGDEGIAALVAPPAAGALPPPTGVLTKLKELSLCSTRVNDTGCAALAAALDSGALPALDTLYLLDIPASDAAQAAVYESLTLILVTSTADIPSLSLLRLS